MASKIPSIEQVWDYLKIQTGKCEKWPISIHELWEIALEE
jgi:hypothetical protein